METHSLIPGQVNQRSDRATRVAQLESQFQRVNQLWDAALGDHWRSTQLPARMEQAQCRLKDLEKSIDVHYDDLASLRENVDRLVTQEQETHTWSANLVFELGEKQGQQRWIRQEQRKLRDETDRYRQETRDLIEATRSNKKLAKQHKLKIHVEAAVYANATGVIEPEFVYDGQTSNPQHIIFKFVDKDGTFCSALQTMYDDMWQELCQELGFEPRAYLPVGLERPLSRTKRPAEGPPLPRQSAPKQENRKSIFI